MLTSQRYKNKMKGGSYEKGNLRMVKLSKKATVTTKGTDFKPGQEVELLFTAVDGVLIRY